MTHAFDSEVSLHYWLLWPTVRRPPDFYVNRQGAIMKIPVVRCHYLLRQQQKNINKTFLMALRLYLDGPHFGEVIQIEQYKNVV